MTRAEKLAVEAARSLLEPRGYLVTVERKKRHQFIIATLGEQSHPIPIPHKPGHGMDSAAFVVRAWCRRILNREGMQ